MPPDNAPVIAYRIIHPGRHVLCLFERAAPAEERGYLGYYETVSCINPHSSGPRGWPGDVSHLVDGVCAMYGSGIKNALSEFGAVVQRVTNAEKWDAEDADDAGALELIEAARVKFDIVTLTPGSRVMSHDLLPDLFREGVCPPLAK